MTHTSGIYQIKNTLNGKLYVGSAKSFKTRWNIHKSDLSRNTHANPHLQAAYNKYGSEAFEYSVLLYCSKDDLLFYEQRAMDTLKPEYNICKVAGNTLGTKRSEETRAKMSLKKIGNKNGVGRIMTEHNKQALILLSKQPKTEEHKAKLSASHKGKKLTEEHKAKISASLTDHYRKVS